MAAKPVAMQVIVYPKNKTVPPYPASIMGFEYDPTVGIGGGPILPPDLVPPIDPPLVIWPGPGPIFPIEPHPEHPIYWPPEGPPDQPPSSSTQPVKKNAWNWNDGKNPQYPNAGWYYVYVPGEGEAGPKRR